jgi:glycosyltransferase involved in cell wall biosynthesis
LLYHRDAIEHLEIPADAMVIGGGGWMSFHKGVDLWIEVAKQIVERARDTNPYFIWLGFCNNAYGHRMAKAAGSPPLRGRTIFVGEVSNPYPYLAIMDIFVLSSRYESFGLFGIEAAYLKKPVVCFGGAGGPVEVLTPEIGVVVPDLDAGAMADAVITLVRNPDLRLRLGAAGRKRVLENFQITHKAREVRAVIIKVLAQAKY